VSPVRPFEQEDLPRVASLYELVARSGSAEPAPGLAEYLKRTIVDHPWTDPELPSYVYEDRHDGIIGFIASHPRRLVHGDQPLRMACSGQLVAHPDARARGVGALLLRRYLAGPQDLTITDGATDTVRLMWEGLGGSTNTGASVGWTRVLAPLTYAGLELSHRRGRSDAQHSRRGWALQRALPYPRPVREPAATSEPLTAEALVEALAGLSRPYRIRPDYDPGFLEWLFRELDAVAAARGEVHRRLVRTREGRVAGWYVAFVRPGGIAQVMQLAARPGDDAGLVLDELLHHADTLQAAAVRGRLEHHLYPLVRERQCLLHRTEWALLHSGDPALLGAATTGQALLTRLEGEWWMGHHLDEVLR
jgi:hypothetical protein